MEIRRTLTTISIACSLALLTPSYGDIPHKYSFKYDVKRFTVKSYLSFVRFVESSDNYKRKGGGAYQLKTGTRSALIERNPFLGISESNWMKPANQDLLAAILLKECAQNLSIRKLPVNTLNLYLVHQLGTGLFTRMIAAHKDPKIKLSNKDLKLLRNNKPCKAMSDNNSKCVKAYSINNASDFYEAWSDKIVKASLNKTAISATSVVAAVNNRIKWRLNTIKKEQAKAVTAKSSKRLSSTTLFKESDLKHVSKDAKKFYYAFKKHMLKSFGLRVAVPKSGAYRSRRDQLKLYAKGRTRKFRNLKNGKPRKVTWTMSSYHTHGKALDIVWAPTYSSVVNKRVVNHMNLLIAKQMRVFARKNCYGAKFLSLRKDPNHVQFGSIKRLNSKPTAAEYEATSSWRWLIK